MAYKVKKFGDYRERRSFSKTKNVLELNDLLEIQKKSYKEFLETGIKEIFDDLFPVESFTGNISLEFGDYYFDEPRYSIKEAKERMVNYAAPLKVEARLFIHETGEVKEQTIFLGDMPLMTDAGTFIINGAERVIVSQLVRSPSVYFKKEIDKNGRHIISGELIPNKGTWLEYETDARDVLYVRIDRTRKVTVTTFLRALGLSSDEDIISVFGDNEYIKNTLEKDSTSNTDEALLEIYEKLRPGEPATLDSSKNQLITRFFDRFRYDLAKVGRYKFNKKLNVLDRLEGLTLAEPLIDGKKTLAKSGDVLTKELLEKLKPYFEKGLNVKDILVNEELDDYKSVQTVKVVDPEDNKKTFNIIGVDQSVDVRRLTIPDVYASLNYYIGLHKGIGFDDEIDNLGNRRVRQVGELIQNQFRIGMARMERVIRERMTTQELDTVTPKTLINIRPVTAALKEFFGSSQLSKFMDQINPIAELTDKRRLSSLGPGGLSRDRAGMDVRDVNASHYGRICPIESPEGQNIGLITSLAGYAKINEYGFIMTPYHKVVNGVVTDEVCYLTADEEKGHAISQAAVKLDDNNKIIPLISRAMAQAKKNVGEKVKTEETQSFSFDAIKGKSEGMQQAVALARKVSATDVTVLLTGETGTGKEVFAQAIHRNSLRKENAFVAVNCSAFSKDLLESEIFGHKAGSFTGAMKDKKGLFEVADNGTIFLDEIGEMAFELQAKLLRVLEAGEYIKIGDTKPTKVNVRVISATNRDLKKEIEQGNFREDLYYRLSVFQIHLPPLRERKEDIELLAESFIQLFSKKLGKQVEGMAPEFLKALKAADWRGNIRELRNVIERSMIVCDKQLTLQDLPIEIQNARQEDYSGKNYSEFELAAMEKRHIAKVLQHTKGNKTEASRLLKIGLTTLYRKIEEYGI